MREDDQRQGSYQEGRVEGLLDDDVVVEEARQQERDEVLGENLFSPCSVHSSPKLSLPDDQSWINLTSNH